MDSSRSSISSLGVGADEATKLLKDLLNVGKPRSASSSETSTASLASNLKDAIASASVGNRERSPLSSGVEGASPLMANSRGGYKGPDLLGNHSQSPPLVDYDPDRGEDGGGGRNSLATSNGCENGQASISELLRTLGRQVITKQQILLEGSDNRNSFSVYGREVDIVSSTASGSTHATAGSNKVKTKNVVAFDWEHKHYVGNLVAVHKNGIHVAYVLRGQSGGIVRVMNMRTIERALLKGFQGLVVDIAFAHISPVVLGCVDEVGNMVIYEILEGPKGNLDTCMLLRVNRPTGTLPSDNHRLSWCPYIPDEEESSGTTANTTSGTESSSAADDASKLLVLTHDEVAEMWNIDMVMREHGSGPLLPADVEVGLLTIESHKKAITDAAFSPDGTALCTASLDGFVKFFQVYMHDRSPPRCLHEWTPHEGKPVTCVIFLDDHKHPNPDAHFWKFLVTGSDKNSEIKVWGCETWTCLQTVRVLPSPSMSGTLIEPCIKAQIDLSANFLVLSDIRRKVLYVLQLFQDPDNSRAHVCSVSEFLLTLPCLSMAVLDASRRKFKKVSDPRVENAADLTTGEVGEEEGEEVSQAESGMDVGVLVKVYAVQTRALQEHQIRFKPESSTPEPPPLSMSSLSHDESALRDPLSDMSFDAVTSDPDRPRAPSTDRSDQPTPPSGRASGEQPHAAAAGDTNQSGPLRLSEGEVVLAAGPGMGQGGPGPASLMRLSDGEVLLGQPLGHPLGHPLGQPLGQPTPGGRVPGPGGGAAAVHTPPSSTGSSRESSQPVLLTPDAFTSSPSRRTDLGAVADTLRSSGGSNLSSFTHVTAMDDDALRTPLASVSQSQNQPSPASSITLTPASSRDLSAGGGSPRLPDTPSSVPLPPLTPGEEASLASPRAQPGQLHPLQGIVGTAPLPASPSTPPAAAGSRQVAHAFMTSSPSSLKAGDFRPDSSTDTATEDPFHAPAQSQRKALKSTGSSSSTSLEVSEILEGVGHQGQTVPYEEEEEEEDSGAEERQRRDDDRGEGEGAAGDEVPPPLSLPLPGAAAAAASTTAVVANKEDEAAALIAELLEGDGGRAHPLGEGAQVETTRRTLLRGDVGGQGVRTHPLGEGSPRDRPRGDGGLVGGQPLAPLQPLQPPLQPLQALQPPLQPLQALQPLQPSPAPGPRSRPDNSDGSAYDCRIWPKPPDLDVDTQAQRLAAEAIEKAAETRLSSEVGEEEEEAEIEEDIVMEEEEEEGRREGDSDMRQREGDVQIEEEKEEDEAEDSSDRLSSPRRAAPAANSSSASVDHRVIVELQASVQSMLALLQSQQREIELLRCELSQQQSATDSVGTLQTHILNLESALSTRLVGALSEHSHTESQRLQQALGERESQERVKHDHLVTTLSKTLDSSLSSRLEQTVKKEIRQSVVPMVTRLLEPLKEQLHTELATKLTATDQLLRENINKLVRSRQTVEALGQATGNAIQGPLQGACRDILVPAFDRASQSVFHQVNQTFQRGTQEYLQQLDSHMELVRRRQEESRDPLIHQLQALVESFTQREDQLQSHVTLVQASVAHMESSVLQSMTSLQEQLLGQVRQMLQEEVTTAIQDQQANLSDQLLSAMRSGAVTPVPVPPAPADPAQQRNHVLQLLRQGQLNSAFQQALSAADLSLVLFVCETVNPSQVFNQSPCPLQQPVLLSLIQQLSADLSENLELKLKYLQDAVLNLDDANPVSREHMPAVLGQLCQKLAAFIQASPNDKLVRNVRMLLMASQSLLK